MKIGSKLIIILVLVSAASLVPISLKLTKSSAETTVEPYVIEDYTFDPAPAIKQGSLPMEEPLGERYILVNIAEQKLQAYENGERVIDAIISTGRKGRETPRGIFHIVNKHPRAYSRVAALWMPYWMAFHHDGEYWLGFHELPEWGNGVKEGEEHLGLPYSGGCIRLGVGPAQAFYDWAEPGDTVLVY